MSTSALHFQDTNSQDKGSQTPILVEIPFIDTEDALLYVTKNIHKDIASSYDKLSKSLMSKLYKGESKVVLVTSTKDGEGKSSVVANLAVSLSDYGYKVVIVDANLQKPEIHRFFEIPDENGTPIKSGIADVILYGASYQSVLITTKVKDIKLISTGFATENQSSILSSKEMEKLLQHLKNVFDVVLIDAPSLQDKLTPAGLARKADGVLFVHRPNLAPLSNVKSYFESLKIMKANIWGVILNGVTNPKKSKSKITNPPISNRDGSSPLPLVIFGLILVIIFLLLWRLNFISIGERTKTILSSNKPKNDTANIKINIKSDTVLSNPKPDTSKSVKVEVDTIKNITKSKTDYLKQFSSSSYKYVAFGNTYYSYNFAVEDVKKLRKTFTLMGDDVANSIFISPAGSPSENVRYRVMIGNYQSEWEARKRVCQLEDISSIIDPIVLYTPYSYIVSAYTTSDSAFSKKVELEKKGYSPYILAKEFSSNKRYLVMLGAFEKLSEAEIFAEEWRKEGIDGEVILR